MKKFLVLLIVTGAVSMTAAAADAPLIQAARKNDTATQHIATNRAPSVNLLLNIAELADVRMEKIGPSTGRLDI